MLLGMALSLCAEYLLCGLTIISYISTLCIVIATVLATCLLWMIRIAVKNIYDISLVSIDSKYAYIYGVKNGGIGIAKHIRNEKPTRFDLKGFVSDDKEEEDKILMGVRVYKLDNRLIQTMTEEGIEALIVSPAKADAFRNNEELQDELMKAGIHIYMTQQAKEWDGSNEIETPQLKEICIEDLLPRDEIQVDLESLASHIKGYSIMITGAAG